MTLSPGLKYSDCQKTLIISLGMHEGAAAPSYLRPGLAFRPCPSFGRPRVRGGESSILTPLVALKRSLNPPGRGSGSQTTFANLQPRKARPSKSAAAACTQQGWKPFGLPSRQRRPRTAKSKILTPRRRSGPSGRFLYHFSSRPGPRFTCPGFRPCGAHVPLAPLRVASTLGKSMICHR